MHHFTRKNEGKNEEDIQKILVSWGCVVAKGGLKWLRMRAGSDSLLRQLAKKSWRNFLLKKPIKFQFIFCFLLNSTASLNSIGSEFYPSLCFILLAALSLSAPCVCNSNTKMLQLNPHFDSIGPQFVQVYYETFRNNRAGLAELYTENSLLTYEGTQFRGAAAILQKLQQLPAVVNHQLVTCDCQPTPNGGVLIIVCGDLAIEDNPPMKFTQTFNLVPNGSGTYAVFNDCFRLCIG